MLRFRSGISQLWQNIVLMLRSASRFLSRFFRRYLSPDLTDSDAEVTIIQPTVEEMHIIDVGRSRSINRYVRFPGWKNGQKL